jgi:hypothetical protein
VTASRKSSVIEVMICVRFSRSMPACRLPTSSWHHDPCAAVGRHPVEGVVEVRGELVAHRVQAVGPIEGYEGHPRAG